MAEDPSAEAPPKRKARGGAVDRGPLDFEAWKEGQNNSKESKLKLREAARKHAESSAPEPEKPRKRGGAVAKEFDFAQWQEGQDNSKKNGART